MMQTIERFSQFYQNLDAQSVEQLSNLYAVDVEFIDPVTRHQGLEQVKHYFSGLLQNTLECRFEIHRSDNNGAQHYISWTMFLRHPKLKSGQLISFEGISHLTIEHGLITYHRDFYDMGEMLYQHIPLLGSVVKHLKRRLSP